MSAKAASRKRKLTISIKNDLAEQISSIAKTKGASRSRVIEDMILYSLREYKKRDIERKIEEYYSSMSRKEKQEERDWTAVSAESAKRIWRD
jgi:metal-responsive CopG/Arc/MetJ family transcriptional regulator